MEEIYYNPSPKYSGRGDGLNKTLEKVASNFAEVSSTLEGLGTFTNDANNAETAEIAQLRALYVKFAGSTPVLVPEDEYTKAEVLEALADLPGAGFVDRVQFNPIELPTLGEGDVGVVVLDTADSVLKMWDGIDWNPFFTPA